MSKRTKRLKAIERNKSLIPIDGNGDKNSYEVDKTLEDLYHILNFMRPADSKEEKELIETIIVPLGAKPDEYGNYILRINNPDGTLNPVLWSCHTDTVHFRAGKQKLYMDTTGVISSNGGSCLGADDGAGIWLMKRMIETKIPGLYVFHRDEEVGGHGSTAIAAQSKAYRSKQAALTAINAFKVEEIPDLIIKAELENYIANNTDPLDSIKYAIAFDRKGLTSIITHQGLRCCSDQFADSLALELSDGIINFQKDTGGTFTDTANYTSVIPECTNISVGYYNQHTSNETLNTIFLKNLLGVLLQFDSNNLVEHRKCNDKPEYNRWNNFSRGYSSEYYDEFYDYEPNHNRNDNTNTVERMALDYDGKVKSLYKSNLGSEEVRWTYMLVKLHPGIVAEILEDHGFDYDTLEQAIKDRGGKV